MNVIDFYRKKRRSTITSLGIGVLAITLVAVSACKKNETPNAGKYESDFSKGLDNWAADFSEWMPPYSEEQWNFVFERSSLPPPLNTNNYSIKIGGTNRSDDLFMFLKREITGLKPNTAYELVFEIEMASNAPTDGAGVGGSPSALTIKAGAIIDEPRVAYNHQADLYVLTNLDKGDQSAEGINSKVLGNIGVKPGQKDYALIQRNNKKRPHRIVTDAEGSIWVFVGTDSGYEARTELYYKSIKITFYNKS